MEVYFQKEVWKLSNLETLVPKISMNFLLIISDLSCGILSLSENNTLAGVQGTFIQREIEQKEIIYRIYEK